MIRKYCHHRSNQIGQEYVEVNIEKMLVAECCKKINDEVENLADAVPEVTNQGDDLLPSTKKLDNLDLAVIQNALINHFLFKDLQIEIL